MQYYKRELIIRRKRMNKIAIFLFCAAFVFLDARIPVLSILFVAGGIVVIWYKRKLVKEFDRFGQYMNMIQNQNLENIDSIAAKCGRSYESVLTDLNKMISLDILGNAIIDHETRSVVFLDGSGIHEGSGTASEKKTPPPQMVSVVCPGCGWKTTIPKGTSCHCEYCNTQLSG